MIRDELARTLSRAAASCFSKEITLDPALLEIPPDPSLGDYALPCFVLARELKTTPHDIAHRLANALSSPLLERSETKGPYLNLFLSSRALAAHISRIKKRKKKRGPVTVIEYISPNTNKPLHLGHVRNAVLGISIANLLEHKGERVMRTCLVNDRGIAICKSMLAFTLATGAHRKASPKKNHQKGDHLVGEYYVLFAQAAKENPQLEERAQQMLVTWEAGDKNIRALWKKMNAWALSGHQETYKRLGVKFTKTYYESDIYTKGRALILAGVKRGVFAKDETGAVIAPLEHAGLPDKVLLRRDGTTLYITQDLYLGVERAKKYRAAQVLYVVGPEQKLYFQQLFAIFKLLGYPWTKNVHHLWYGYVSLPEGRMKSREGTVVDADTLLDELESLAHKEVLKRFPTISKKESLDRARIIAHAALFYYMAHVRPENDITFSPKESISFQGHTGPYLLYTYARIKSILSKAHTTQSRIVKMYEWSEEKSLLLLLDRYEEILARAADEHAPSLLAHYLYELSQKTNEYYHAVPVLKSPTASRGARLFLLSRIADTLKQGLSLLGIETLERM